MFGTTKPFPQNFIYLQRFGLSSLFRADAALLQAVHTSAAATLPRPAQVSRARSGCAWPHRSAPVPPTVETSVDRKVSSSASSEREGPTVYLGDQGGAKNVQRTWCANEAQHTVGESVMFYIHVMCIIYTSIHVSSLYVYVCIYIYVCVCVCVFSYLNYQFICISAYIRRPLPMGERARVYIFLFLINIWCLQLGNLRNTQPKTSPGDA